MKRDEAGSGLNSRDRLSPFACRHGRVAGVLVKSGRVGAQARLGGEATS